MNSKLIDHKPLKLTDKQLEWAMLLPNSADVAAGRGSGKTTHIATPWVIRNIIEMPRALGAIAGKTYAQVLTNILPKFLKALNDYGLEQNRHYWIGRKPPPEYPYAYHMPIDLKRCITFANGHCIVILSQDNKSPSNGLDIQWLWVDEFKLIDYPLLSSEVVPTLRGLRMEYGKCSGYLGMLTTTDKPRKAEAPWFYQRQERHDQEAYDRILAIGKQIYLREQALLAGPSKSKREKLEKELKELNEWRLKERKKAFICFEMTTIDNLQVLGPDAIIKLKEEMDDLDFRRAVLNEDDGSNDAGFYAMLNYQKHLYNGDRTEYIAGLSLRSNERNFFWDRDIIHSAPLYISMDFNAAISCMVVAQKQDDVLMVLNAFYATHTMTLATCVEKFIKYYKQLPSKRVIFIYDNTAVNNDATGRKSFADTVTDQLHKAGFFVTKRYIGQATRHHERYQTLYSLFAETDPKAMKIRFNSGNCQQLLTSMSEAKVKMKGSFYHKDKSSERAKYIRPEDATHMSEAFDTLVTGLMSHRSSGASHDLTTIL